MSKRPSIGPETVVRHSRLAVKGEAVPVTRTLGEEPLARALAESPAAPAPPAAAAVAPGLVEELLARLAERDHQIDHLRSELRQAEHKAAREKADAVREREKMAGELAAADATIDELRNRVTEQRRTVDHAQAELIRLAEIHAQERQQLLEQYREECERLAAMAGVVDVAEVPASAGDAFPRGRRWWMFGETSQSRVNVNATRDIRGRGRK